MGHQAHNVGVVWMFLRFSKVVVKLLVRCRIALEACGLIIRLSEFGSQFAAKGKCTEGAAKPVYCSTSLTPRSEESRKGRTNGAGIRTGIAGQPGLAT